MADAQRITARHRGRCCNCGGQIEPGDALTWVKGEPVVHAVCPDNPVPAQPAGFQTRPVRKLGRVVCRECGGNHLWNNCPLMAPRKGKA